MRRRDREVTDPEEVRHILSSCKVLHLGIVEEGKPYIVPMNYGYEFRGEKLFFYLHAAREGRKLDIIRKNPVCCVQMECEGRLIEGKVACQYGFSYYSLEGFGNACIVEEPEEKIKALSLLMKEQTGKDFEFNERLVSIVSVIRVECDSYTAKHRPLPQRVEGE